MDNNEFQVKIEELKKLHKEAQSKANQIEEQISKLQDEHTKLLMDNLRSNFVNKYFKLENEFVNPDYFYIRNVYPDEHSYDDICFVGDRISTYDGTYHAELHIDINSEWRYIKTENLVEITKDEFMTAYDKACKEMLSRGLGEPNQ